MKYHFSRNRCAFGARAFAILMLAFSVAIIGLDIIVRPTFANIAQSEARKNASRFINQAYIDYAAESEIKYEDLVNISRDRSDNRITSVQVNTVTVNRMISSVLKKIYANTDADKNIRYKINVGSLTRSVFLQGKGPEITVVTQLSRYTKYKIKSSFSSAGINQTKHSVYLELTTSLYVVVPGQKNDEEITSEFLIAETIIVGDSPSNYTCVNQVGEGTFDAIDAITNFKNN